MVILPNTELNVATRVAERMRTMIMVAGAPSGKAGRTAARGDRWTTISLGVATIRPGDTNASPEDLIDRADKAMYEAKRQGRNRVCRAAGASSPERPARRKGDQPTGATPEPKAAEPEIRAVAAEQQS